MKFVIKLCLLLSLINLAQAQVVLRFHEKINAQATTLGDVIRIEGDNQHWSQLKLDSRPQAGESLSREQIIQWMSARLGHFDWQWRGKTQTTIRQTLQSSEQALLEKAQQVLMQELSKAYSRVELKVLSHPKGSEYPIGSFHTRVKIISPTAKRVCVWLSNDHQELAVWFSVNAYQRVLVANQNKAYHTQAHADDFSWQERNVAGLSNQPCIRLPEKAWLTTTLQRNQILLTNQISEAPQIRQGEKVQVNIYNHGITSATEAFALSDGYVGQMIGMKNPANQKTFVAKVSGNQQVEIRS